MKYHQTQSKSEKVIVPAMVGSQVSTGQVNLTIPSNNNYKKLVGIMLLIFNSNGEPHTKEALVSASTTSGMIVLPEQPYACIRPSFQEKAEDRIIPIDEITAQGHDFRFSVSIPNRTAEIAEFSVNAICFFTTR